MGRKPSSTIPGRRAWARTYNRRVQAACRRRGWLMTYRRPRALLHMGYHGKRGSRAGLDMAKGCYPRNKQPLAFPRWGRRPFVYRSPDSCCLLVCFYCLCFLLCLFCLGAVAGAWDRPGGRRCSTGVCRGGPVIGAVPWSCLLRPCVASPGWASLLLAASPACCFLPQHWRPAAACFPRNMAQILRSSCRLQAHLREGPA